MSRPTIFPTEPMPEWGERHVAQLLDRARSAEQREARLRKALEASVVAIDDWLHTFAPELCGADAVAETEARINEGGTLWYIATTQEANRAALADGREG